MSDPDAPRGRPSIPRSLNRRFVLGLGLIGLLALVTTAALMATARATAPDAASRSTVAARQAEAARLRTEMASVRADSLTTVMATRASSLAAAAAASEAELLRTREDTAASLRRIALCFALTLFVVLVSIGVLVVRPATQAVAALLREQEAARAELYAKADEMYRASVEQEIQNETLQQQQQTLLEQQEELIAQQATLIEHRDHLEERTSQLSRLTAILDATPDAVAVFSLTGEILYANASAELLLQSVRRRDWTHAAHLLLPESVRRVRDEAFPRALRRGLWQGEVQLRSRGGPQRTMVQTMLTHRSADGRVATVSVMLQDVTEARVQARELETLSLVARQSDHAIVTTDPKGVITWVNPSWERLTGFPLADALGRRPGELLQGTHTNSETVAQIRQAIRSGNSFTGELLNYRRDGTPYWIETSITPSRNGEGELTGFVGLSRDITARRNADRERQQLAAAVAVTADGIAITGVSGALEFVNHAFARMHGHRAADLIATPWAALYDPAEAQRLALEAIPQVTQVGFWQGEATGRHRDGSTFPEELSLTLLPHGGLVAVSRDISERKAAEERLKHLSVRDELTSLYNRRGFIEQADAMLKLAARQGTPCALLYGDLDGFKAVNDTYGHNAGDEALQTVAGILSDCFRTTDLVARLGGDEFTILAIDVLPDDVAMLQARVQQAVERSNLQRGDDMQRAWRLGISLGVAYFDPQAPEDVEALLRAADAAQYERKRARKAALRPAQAA